MFSFSAGRVEGLHISATLSDLSAVRLPLCNPLCLFGTLVMEQKNSDLLIEVGTTVFFLQDGVLSIIESH